MLARLNSRLPRGDVWRYGPKFDGFRGLLARGENGAVQLLSRNLRDLAASFPELVNAGRRLPSGTVVGGEIVIADDRGYSDFGALQHRWSVRGRMAHEVAKQRPAVPVVFDLLRLMTADLTQLPLVRRRARLEDLRGPGHNCLQLVSHTADAELAEDWLSLAPGLEGVVAKRADGRYWPGRRDWVKIKRHHTVDCAGVGIAGELATPKLVLALRHPDGRLHHLGRLEGVICHVCQTRMSVYDQPRCLPP
jgi:ATP-dependent DNA ligase